MHSIAHNIVAVAVVIVTAAPLASVSASPSILQDPLLGLRYEVATTRFEPMPADLAAKCSVLAGSENMGGVWFVYARARDATGKSYYLVNGYEIRRRPAPPDLPKYETGGFGMLVSVQGDQCALIDADARQVFDDRIFDEELPQDVLQRLATDFAARLAAAFGGVDRLGAELMSQRVDLDALPIELRNAFRGLRQSRRK